jgi:hypothetical protein
MIANISPSIIHSEETHNTLKYANRAKEIKTRAVQNTVSFSYVDSSGIPYWTISKND